MTPRIGLDYMPAVQHAPGIGRYVRELVRALVRRADAPPLGLFEGGLGPRPMEGSALGLADALVPPRRRRVRIPRRALHGLAQLGLGPERLVGASLFHRVHAGHPPAGRGAAVPTTLAVAEIPSAPEALEPLRRAAREADAVVTFSRHLLGRLERELGVPESRLAWAPVGSEHWERDLGGRTVELRDPPEILALGAVRRARRPLELLRGFEALRAGGRTARLVFCGRAGDAAAEFESALSASPVATDVEWIRHPVEADMPSLVAGAAVLAHLAADEGTPVTALEACRLGPVVVADDLPALREALGNSAHWLPTEADATAVASALDAALDQRLASNATARRTRREIARAFTWDACAEAHIQVWHRILNL